MDPALVWRFLCHRYLKGQINEAMAKKMAANGLGTLRLSR